MKNKKLIVIVVAAIFVISFLVLHSPKYTGKYSGNRTLFLETVDNCVAYEGNVYFMYRGTGISGVAYPHQKAEEVTQDMLPEGFVYIGELEDNSGSDYYFTKDTMQYKEYYEKRAETSVPGFYFPRDPGKAVLYYNAQKDQCLVLFSQSGLKDADGAVWFRRDDHRLGYDMIP